MANVTVKYRTHWFHADVHPYEWVLHHPREPRLFGVGLLFMADKGASLHAANILKYMHPRLLDGTDHMAQAILGYRKALEIANIPYEKGTLGELCCMVDAKDMPLILKDIALPVR